MKCGMNLMHMRHFNMIAKKVHLLSYSTYYSRGVVLAGCMNCMRVDGRIGAWADGWMRGCIDTWMDGQTDGEMLGTDDKNDHYTRPSCSVEPSLAAILRRARKSSGHCSSRPRASCTGTRWSRSARSLASSRCGPDSSSTTPCAARQSSLLSSTTSLQSSRGPPPSLSKRRLLGVGSWELPSLSSSSGLSSAEPCSARHPPFTGRYSVILGMTI